MLQRRVSPAKKYLRRTLQVIALVCTLLIGIVALALIVSQTPWFKDWLRRFIVRESKQYVNGNLSIGSLGGNLFYGVQLGDVAIDVNGEHIVTLKRLEVKYSVTELISSGMTVREIRLEQPFVLLRHDQNGWNVANLVKRQQQEADRQGPGKPLSMPDIQIVDGRAVIEDKAPSEAYTLPSRIDGLNVKAGFEYAPVHYSLTIDRLQLAARAPDLTVTTLTGRIGTRDDNLNVEKLALKTAQSSVTIDGVVRDYLNNPSLQLTVSAPALSLPEFAGVLPAVRGYTLRPALDLKASGPQNNLELTIDAKSEAGSVNGTITADAKAPDFAARGRVDVANLNLAPLLKDPAQRSDITGRATVDVRMASAPADAPALSRMRGTFALDAPHVVAAGYRANAIAVRGTIEGRRIGIDGRAGAYGGTAVAKGTVIAPAAAGDPLQFDVAGSIAHVNLANLPRSANAPRVATDVNARAYHVKGSIGKTTTTIEGNATLGRSTLAGGTIVDGTSAEFGIVTGPRRPLDARYTARGGVRDVNLYRVGEAFNVAALNKPEYDSRINADFDVTGTGTDVATMTVDGAATITDSQVMGGTVPRLSVEAHLANGAVRGRANGSLNGFDPARITGNEQYKGQVNGTVDASFSVRDVAAPITPDAITADGRMTLTDTTVAGVEISNAEIQGQYADRRGELRQATIKGPDLELQASGPIALDSAGHTNLTFHIAATDLARVGELVEQPIGGSAIVDGTVTGNASSLTVAGTLDGSNLSYQENNALDLGSTFSATVPDLQVAHARVQADTKATFVEAGGLKINELTAHTTYADQKLDFRTHIAEAPGGEAAEASAAEAGTTAANPSGARELDASGSVILHPDHQEIHLPNLALRTQGVEWRTAPGSAAAVQYGSNRIELHDVRLVSGSQSLTVSGAFSLGENTAPGAITVTAQNIDIAQLEKLALQNRGLTGTLNANAKITGTAKAPAVEGHVEVANGGFQKFTYQSLTADATYGSDRVVLDARLRQSPGVELTAAGTVPMSALRPNPPGVTGHVAPRAGDELDVRVQSTRIDLGLVQGFTNQVTNVTGTVQADVRVTGSGEDPHLAGFVDIQNGAFEVVEAGTRFSGLTTRIELQPENVHVPRFQILDEHGNPLTVAGDLAVHQRQAGAVNISVDSDNFKLVDNELGDVHAETHLKITGEVRQPRVEGEVRLDQARLEIDKILLMFASPYREQALPEVVTAQETASPDTGAQDATRQAFEKGRQLGEREAATLDATAPKTPAPQQGPASALALDVHLVVPDNMVVRGEDLRPGGATAMQVGNVNATVGADLRVRKDPYKPIVVRGTVTTVRGFYEFQGRRFELVRGGSMQFLGLPEINPNLDLSAKRLIPNTGVTANIHITGTLRAPELALSSEPPLEESDILSLIIFNRAVNELGTGERASLAETAGGIASGFIAAPLSRSIGKALDVDLFEITTSDPQTGETAGGVTLGKQVSDKAFVRFRQQFGQRSFTEFMLEYDLARFLRVQTTLAPETTSAANRLTQRRVEKAGIDLIFFFSY
jgi:autotransporter translocation and assembly factor TamB